MRYEAKDIAILMEKQESQNQWCPDQEKVIDLISDLNLILAIYDNKDKNYLNIHGNFMIIENYTIHIVFILCQYHNNENR